MDARKIRPSAIRTHAPRFTYCSKLAPTLTLFAYYKLTIPLFAIFRFIPLDTANTYTTKISIFMMIAQRKVPCRFILYTEMLKLSVSFWLIEFGVIF